MVVNNKHEYKINMIVGMVHRHDYNKHDNKHDNNHEVLKQRIINMVKQMERHGYSNMATDNQHDYSINAIDNI